MPRVEFGDDAERTISWILKRVGKNKYECYVTDNLEIILHPLKSTKPITYGYYKTTSISDIKRILETVRRLEVDIHRCKVYEWNPENPIGSKYEPE